MGARKQLYRDQVSGAGKMRMKAPRRDSSSRTSRTIRDSSAERAERRGRPPRGTESMEGARTCGERARIREGILEM